MAAAPTLRRSFAWSAVCIRSLGKLSKRSRASRCALRGKICFDTGSHDPPAWPMRHRILFVCAGNTCRGPIAAALAASILPEAVVCSAGLMPGYAVAHHAISVVQELTGADISTHVPGDVAERDLTRFDRIVALDRFVAADLESTIPADATLVIWDIPDPYGRSLDDYRQCAETLRDRIQEWGPGC